MSRGGREGRSVKKGGERERRRVGRTEGRREVRR